MDHHEEEQLLSPFLAVACTGQQEDKRLLSRLWRNGSFTISLSALVCSLIPLFIKELHESVHAMEVTLVSSMISWCMTSMWLLSSGEELQCIWARRLNLLVLRGALGALVCTMYWSSIQMLPMQVAVSLYFTNPAMAVLLDWLINRKPIKGGTIAGCACSIAGVYLISHQMAGNTGNGSGAVTAAAAGRQLFGAIFCLVAALGTAGGYVCVHAIGADVPLQALMWWYHAMTMIASAASFAHGMPMLLPSWQQAGWLGGVAGAHFTGQLLLNHGFSTNNASHGSALFAQQVLYSYMWHVTIMNGNIQLCAVLGSAAILVGVLCVTESSGMSRAQGGLASQRSQSQVLRRRASGRVSLMDRMRSRHRHSLSLSGTSEEEETSSLDPQHAC